MLMLGGRASRDQFEWLRQWYIQGSGHAAALTWWVPRIQKLRELWVRLEQRTATRFHMLQRRAAAA